MSNTTKGVLAIIGLILAGWILIGIVKMVLAYAIPILILGAIGYVAYEIVSKKALAGGRKTLP